MAFCGGGEGEMLCRRRWQEEQDILLYRKIGQDLSWSLYL